MGFPEKPATKNQKTTRKTAKIIPHTAGIALIRAARAARAPRVVQMRPEVDGRGLRSIRQTVLEQSAMGVLGGGRGVRKTQTEGGLIGLGYRPARTMTLALRSGRGPGHRGEPRLGIG